MSSYKILNPNAKWSNFDQWHVEFMGDEYTRIDIDHILWCKSCAAGKAVIEEVFCDSDERWDRILRTKSVSASRWAAAGRCPVFLLGMDGPEWGSHTWLANVSDEERITLLVAADSSDLKGFLRSVKCPVCHR